MRIGAKKRPFYRVVVVDERAKRTGGYIESLGTYNPLTTPKDIKLKQDRIDYWIKQGAQMSTGYLRIIGKAPQRPPRKPKKEKKKEEPVTPATETPSSDTPSTDPVIPRSPQATEESQDSSGDSSPAGPVQSDKPESEDKNPVDSSSTNEGSA